MSGFEPAAYQAARAGAVVFGAGGRQALRIWGREPGQMLQGITTGRIPGEGEWAHSAILTPKGRMVSDLRIFALPSEDPEFVLDLPAAGADPVRDHLTRVLPPRFARAEPWGHVCWTVVGPDGAGLLADVLQVPTGALVGMAEGAVTHCPDGSVVLRTPAAATNTFEVWTDREAAGGLFEAAVDGGAVAGSAHLWEILRVEAGQPEFGVDMGADSLLPETGLADRAVDHTKGCYTGQEVVVRIRDRGHVNRHLRGLLLSTAAPAPAAGDPLFGDDTGKAVGTITSLVESPAAERTLGLGYVRREVEPGGAVRVGLPVGPLAEVRELGAGWWR